MQVNLSNGLLQNQYFSGTGSIGGIHLPDFDNNYVFSKKSIGLGAFFLFPETALSPEVIIPFLSGDTSDI